MKTLVFLIAASIATTISCHEITTGPKFIEIRNECAQANELSDEQLEALKKYNFENADEKVFCHMKCVFDKMHLYNDADGFLANNIIHQLKHGNEDINEQTIRDHLSSCIEEFKDEESKCKQAHLIFKCFITKDNHVELMKNSLVEKDDHEGEHDHHKHD